MSDDDKKKEEPLKNPKVSVNIVPKKGADTKDKKAAEKIGEKLKEKIDKAVDNNKAGGREKQFDAAEAEVDKAAAGVDGNKVDKIKVSVQGENEKGDGFFKGWDKNPKEGKPNP